MAVSWRIVGFAAERLSCSRHFPYNADNQHYVKIAGEWHLRGVLYGSPQCACYDRFSLRCQRIQLQHRADCRGMPFRAALCCWDSFGVELLGDGT